jgi:1-deoxyxylulose-5-phosphate synthase
MEYTNLGSSGLRISRIMFGGAHIGEIIDADQTKKIVHAAWDEGISTFYVADKYNNGAGEEILGEALKPRREDVVIVIKTGYRVGSATVPVTDAERMATHGELGAIDDAEMWAKGVPPTSRGLSRKHMLQAIEASLRRLQTDYIDVYEAHFWDPRTPIEETLETMDLLVRQGKVRYIGCSQTAPWQLHRGLRASEVRGLARYQSWQVRFNILDRAERQQELDAAAEAGVSILAFQSLAGNVLTGDYKFTSAIPDSLGHRLTYTELYWKERNFALVDELRTVARATGRTSVGELAQAWALAQKAIGALQVGPNSPEGLPAQIRAATHPLTADEAQAIDAILANFPAEFSGALRFPD